VALLTLVITGNLQVCFTYYFAVGKQSKGLVALSKPTDLMRVVLYLGGFYLWFTYMSSIPHKEERFLFAIYPQLCFGAALALGLGSEFILAISPSSIRVRRIIGPCNDGNN
jgi:hypothetical protein